MNLNTINILAYQGKANKRAGLGKAYNYFTFTLYGLNNLMWLSVPSPTVQKCTKCQCIIYGCSVPSLKALSLVRSGPQAAALKWSVLCTLDEVHTSYCVKNGFEPVLPDSLVWRVLTFNPKVEVIE